MAVVLKSKNGGMKKSPLSAWLGYGAVAVFGLAIISTAFMGGGKAPDPMDSAYSYSDFKDLADMPFSNEEAEAQLLSSVRYGDIAKNDLINALFSEEDKAERQAEDAKNGVPEPPDEEYAEAAKAKENVEKAKARYRRSRQAAQTAIAQRTSKGSLSSSSGVSVSGGGSGVSSTIWRADDKNNKSSGASSSANSRGGGSLSNQLAQELKKGGRGGGFMAAYEKSRAAANAQDLEAAHALAADAFQNAGDLDDSLKGDLEEMAAGLDLNKAIGAVDKEKGTANTLDEKLSEAKDEADNKDKKKDHKCDGSMLNGKFDMGCVMNGVIEGLLAGAKDALTSALKGGKSAEAAAERAALLETAKNDLTSIEKEITELNSDPVGNADRLKELGQEKKDLIQEVAYFSSNDATQKGWEKFKNKQARKERKTVKQERKVSTKSDDFVKSNESSSYPDKTDLISI